MNIYVFGLGHIGLPLAASICLKGKQVHGVDINPMVINNIESGSINMYEYYQGEHISTIAQRLIENKTLTIQNKFERVDNEPSVFIITVGIGIKDDNSQDISPIQGVLNEILPTLAPRDLLLFRTTMIPGTCENFIQPQLKVLNMPIYLAYCPETISETHAFDEFEHNAKVLAGIDDESYRAAETFLNSLSDSPIYKASNIITAELVKVAQNISRDVDIAFINELSEAASALNIDIFELQFLANTHPRVKLLQPGPGVGGYCIPNALGYLKESLKNKNLSLDLMNTARNINDEKPRKIVETVKTALINSGKDIKGSKVAVIGIAMKDCCADCRLSPALDIISILISEGAQVTAYDPLVPMTYSFQTKTFDECIKNTDCIVIAVKQPGVVYDLNEIRALMSDPVIIIDTRNVFPCLDHVKLFKM